MQNTLKVKRVNTLEVRHKNTLKVTHIKEINTVIELYCLSCKFAI